MAVFAVVFIAIFIGLVLIVLLKQTSPPLPQEKVHFNSPEDKPLYLKDREAFKAKCLSFLAKFNLEYRHSIWADDNEVEIEMADETPVVGGRYLALGLFDPAHNSVGLHKVTGFLETIKAEGASRGIIITTGYFSNEAIQASEGEPVELVDVASFLSYLKKFGIYESSE